MGDESPGKTENSGVSSQMSFGEFRELGIVTGRQIVLDLPDLLFNDMEIVEQPLGGRGDRPAVAGGIGNDAVGLVQDFRILAEARQDRPAARGSLQDALRRGETVGVAFKALNAEKLRPNRLVGHR